jgi:hypothetical protein
MKTHPSARGTCARSYQKESKNGRHRCRASRCGNWVMEIGARVRCQSLSGDGGSWGQSPISLETARAVNILVLNRDLTPCPFGRASR